jgi:hypothetical protein
MPGATADNTPIAKRTSPLLVLALLAAGVLAGCGGSKQAETITPATVSVSAGTTRSTQSASRLHRFARTYLRIVAPANAAHARLVEKSRSYGSSTTKTEVVADLVPVIAAYEVADKALLRVHWPPAVEADVRALVVADRALLRDLRAADQQTAQSSGAWTARVARDGEKSNAAADAVRAALGLAAQQRLTR